MSTNPLHEQQLLHSPEEFMIFRWTELQTAWESMASPLKQTDVMDTVEAIRAVYLSHPGNVSMLQLLFATVWLMDSRDSARD